MTGFRAIYLEEPTLTFGLGQAAVHPKDGLFLYGPVAPRSAGEIRIGAIGSAAGIDRLSRWMKQVSHFIPAFNNRAHHAPFPGMEAAFCVKWPLQPVATIVLEEGALETRIRYDDPHRRVYNSVDLVVRELLDFKRRSDIRPDVWMVVLPEEVSRYGRPKSKVPRSERVVTPNRIGNREAKRLGEAPLLFEELESAQTPIYLRTQFSPSA